MDEQSDESKEEEVMGEGIGESEMEERVPEWGSRRDKVVDFRDTIKHNERSDQLFLERMMSVAEQVKFVNITHVQLIAILCLSGRTARRERQTLVVHGKMLRTSDVRIAWFVLDQGQICSASAQDDIANRSRLGLTKSIRYSKKDYYIITKWSR